MTPETIVLGVILCALTLYVVLGGADFGAGVWEFNTALTASRKERALIYRAVQPVWEANHVWLIFVVSGLFTAFPAAFAGLCRALWVPLLLASMGIVFRGVGFTFRSYARGEVRQQAVWGAVFALASTATPFFLGAAAGAVASAKLPVDVEGRYQGNYLTGWITPLAVFTAFFVVGQCAYLAAVYLAREAHLEDDPALVKLWRRRALATGIWMGVLAAVGLVLVAREAPLLWAGFRARAWPLIVVSAVTGNGSLWLLWRRRFTAAAMGASLTAATVVWGWGIAQYPAIIPPAITITTAKAPPAVLWAMVAACAVGALLVAPALAWLFYLFKTRPGLDAAEK